MLFLISSCAHQKSIWPAKIVGFKNFTYEEIDEIKGYIKDLNLKSLSTKNGKSLVNPKASDDNYRIIIKFIHDDTDTEIRIAGTALRKSNECIISVYPVCFEKQILKTVIWHELGHCAKLNHTESKTDIMYKAAKSFDSYKEEDLTRFIDELNKSVWK